MAIGIHQFLEKLADDPKLERRFEKDPNKAMDDAGLLDPSKRKLILTGSLRQIRAEIKKELGRTVDVFLIKMGSPPL